MRKSIISILILFLILAVSIGLNAQGKLAPKITLYNTNDKLVTLSSLVKDNNIILDFWASYRKPCKKEMPQLVELEKEYSAPKRLN